MRPPRRILAAVNQTHKGEGEIGMVVAVREGSDGCVGEGENGRSAREEEMRKD